MKLLTSVHGCTILDKIINEDIRIELDTESINNKISENRQQWAEHWSGLEDYRYSMEECI